MEKEKKKLKGIHLRDLSPEDKVKIILLLIYYLFILFYFLKAKIARLVDQIVGLGIENDSLRKKIITLETQIKESVQQIENQMNETIVHLNQKICDLEKNRNDSLYLLNIYQQKISQVRFIKNKKYIII